ncbi:MAG: hypothetical protein P8Y61_09975 [Gammaproteobacteria bacterium]
MASHGGFINGADRAIVWLPFFLAVLPIFTVSVCYFLSASAGFIPACMPLLEGCTTVSSAGRYGPAYFLFKAGIIPTAILLAAFWPLCRRWFLSLGYPDSTGLRAMVWLGVISAVFLVVYAAALGSSGELYKFMRRSGVTIHFSFSYLAQVLLLNRVWYERGRLGQGQIGAGIAISMVTVSLLMFALGLYSLPVGQLIPDPKDVLINVIEWNFALLLFGWYLIAGFAWLRSGFRWPID